MDSTSLDHRSFVAGLSDEDRLRLTERSDLAGLLHLFSRFAGMAITGYWIFAGFVGWQVALVLHGIQLVFFFTLQHESVHDTPFRSMLLNKLAGWMCALLLFLPPLWFRYFHLAHHRHTHDPEKDPELAGAEQHGLAGYLWRISGIPVWNFQIRTVLKNMISGFDYAYLPKSAEDRVRSEARLMVLIYALVAALSYYLATDALIWLWLVPILAGQPFLRLYLMAEHGRCPHVANMFENTRTTFTNSIIRWLAWNMPYHAEHHAYPNVPFHKLPEFHKLAKAHLKVTEEGYSEFHRKEVSQLL